MSLVSCFTLPTDSIPFRTDIEKKVFSRIYLWAMRETTTATESTYSNKGRGIVRENMKHELMRRRRWCIIIVNEIRKTQARLCSTIPLSVFETLIEQSFHSTKIIMVLLLKEGTVHKPKKTAKKRERNMMTSQRLDTAGGKRWIKFPIYSSEVSNDKIFSSPSPLRVNFFSRCSSLKEVFQVSQNTQAGPCEGRIEGSHEIRYPRLRSVEQYFSCSLANSTNMLARFFFVFILSLESQKT